MRFEIVNKNLTFEEGKIGEVQKIKSLLLQTQTHVPPYDVIRGEFLIEGAELEGYINDGLTYEDIAELKLKALLEVDVTPLDAHQFANIEKQAINAIVEVRNAREDLDVAKAEIKKDIKEQQKEIEQQTSVIMELALMLSQVGTNEETNSENTNPNPDENGGEGSE